MKRNVILTSQCFCCHFCCQWNITKIVKFWSFMELKSPLREYSSAKGSGTHNQQLGSSVLPEAKCFCCFFVSQMFYIHEEKLENQNFCYWITTKTFYNSSLSFSSLYIYKYIYTHKFMQYLLAIVILEFSLSHICSWHLNYVQTTSFHIHCYCSSSVHCHFSWLMSLCPYFHLYPLQSIVYTAASTILVNVCQFM